MHTPSARGGESAAGKTRDLPTFHRSGEVTDTVWLIICRKVQRSSSTSSAVQSISAALPRLSVSSVKLHP